MLTVGLPTCPLCVENGHRLRFSVFRMILESVSDFPSAKSPNIRAPCLPRFLRSPWNPLTCLSAAQGGRSHSVSSS
jgi:hypothetical protein